MGVVRIFIPGGSRASLEVIKSLGAGSIAGDLDPLTTQLVTGPGRLSGTLCEWQAPNMMPSLTYSEKRQEWHACPKNGDLTAGRYWIGWDKDDRPRPADLIKPRQYESEQVTLADGNEWKIPIASLLPRNWMLDDEGQPARRVAPQYQEFCEQAEKIYVAFVTAGEGGNIQIPAGWTFAVNAIALNYRVNDFVVSAIGLINDDVAWKIWAAALGYGSIREAENLKKREATTPATSVT